MSPGLKPWGSGRARKAICMGEASRRAEYALRKADLEGARRHVGRRHPHLVPLALW